MARFCQYCGAPVDEITQKCTFCGFVSMDVMANQQTTSAQTGQVAYGSGDQQAAATDIPNFGASSPYMQPQQGYQQGYQQSYQQGYQQSYPQGYFGADSSQSQQQGYNQGYSNHPSASDNRGANPAQQNFVNPDYVEQEKIVFQNSPRFHSTFRNVQMQTGVPNTDPSLWPIRSKTVAGVLGIVLGSLGIHKFYMGNNSAGITCLLVTLFSCGLFSFVPALIGIIEGIIYLTMDDNEFAEKYHVRLQ